MARKKETRIIHPLAATEALNGYHNDVGMLLATIQSTLSVMKETDVSARKFHDSIAPRLQESIDRVSRWYDNDE